VQILISAVLCNPAQIIVVVCSRTARFLGIFRTENGEKLTLIWSLARAVAVVWHNGNVIVLGG